MVGKQEEPDWLLLPVPVMHDRGGFRAVLPLQFKGAQSIIRKERAAPPFLLVGGWGFRIMDDYSIYFAPVKKGNGSASAK